MTDNIITPDNYPSLPKWPEVYITGRHITPEQARQVITRTDRSLHDSLFWMGGHKRFADEFSKRCDMEWVNKIDDEMSINIRNGMPMQEAVALMRKACEPFCSIWDLYGWWRDQMGVIVTRYIHNDWLSSSYIFGANGWCHPDGVIGMVGHNVGKWPNVEEIAQDWKDLAEAFPFLDLCCTVYNDEAYAAPGRAVATIRVKDGAVTVYHPDLQMHEQLDASVSEPSDELALETIKNRLDPNVRYRSGWPAEWVDEFCSRSREVVRNMKAAKAAREQEEE